MAKQKDKKYENENVGIVLSDHCGYTGSSFEELEAIRRHYFGKESKKPLIAVRYFAESETQVQEAARCKTVNDVLDLLTREGETGIEIALNGGEGMNSGRGKRFNRRELTRDSDSLEGHPRIGDKYSFGIMNNFLGALAHGAYTNGKFFCPTGASVASFGEALATAGPTYIGGINPYEEFRKLADFYDFNLGQQTSELNEHRRFGRDDFFRLKDMAEAEAVIGHGHQGEDFRKFIKTMGITTINQLKARVRKFEEDFFPGEFEEALVGVKQLREWLRSLKD